MPSLVDMLPRKRRVSDLPGYGQASPISEMIRGFAGKQPAYSVMQPDADELRRAGELGEQASVASQFYGALMPFAASAAAAKAGQGIGLSPLTVFHGSPHRFTRFDASKIGTGEGAQAYGHGLYFAENPRVADEYRMMLSTHKLTGEAAQDLANYSLRMKPTVEEAINYLQKEKKTAINQSKSISNEFATNEYVKQYDDAINLLKSNKGEKPGSLYTVDLPDEQIAKMLDWDKPLSQQKDIVKNITPESLGLTYTQLPNGNHAFVNQEGKILGNLQKGGTQESFTKNWMSDVIRGTGQDLYKMLGHGMEKSPAVSGALREAGIPGIRYLDQGSRGVKRGTSNFVVFPGEEQHLKMLEINNVPLVDMLPKVR